MTTELVVIDPVQGEQLELATASEDRLGRLLLDLRDLESRTREIRSLVADELHRRWDRSRSWTTHTDSGLTLSGKSDAPVVVWDAEQLQDVLFELCDEGVITMDAASRAVQTRVELKVLAAGVNALLKSPQIAERIAHCRSEVEPEGRRVSVTAA